MLSAVLVLEPRLLACLDLSLHQIRLKNRRSYALHPLAQCQAGRSHPQSKATVWYPEAFSLNWEEELACLHHTHAVGVREEEHRGLGWLQHIRRDRGRKGEICKETLSVRRILEPTKEPGNFFCSFYSTWWSASPTANTCPSLTQVMEICH